MKAAGKYIILKNQIENKESSSGFKRPANSRFQKAIIYSVGRNVEYYKEGNIVYYDKTQGHDINVNDIEYRITKEDAIVGII